MISEINRKNEANNKWEVKRIDHKIAKLLKKAISYLISFKSQVPLTIAVNIMQ